MKLASVFSFFVLAGCAASSNAPPQTEHANASVGHHESSSEGPQPTRVLADGSRLFGSDLDDARTVTPLPQILATPAQFQGQVVKTQGEIAAVCQRMGCWMEIRAEENSPGVRVPMAGHSFFLPRDVAGNRATIEGRVVVAQLSAEERAHLESEGAQATGQEVSIEATGVVVHP